MVFKWFFKWSLWGRSSWGHVLVLSTLDFVIAEYPRQLQSFQIKFFRQVKRYCQNVGPSEMLYAVVLVLRIATQKCCADLSSHRIGICTEFRQELSKSSIIRNLHCCKDFKPEKRNVNFYQGFFSRFNTSIQFKIQKNNSFPIVNVYCG